jgi:transcription-repair coupling factor (superfamily II helicase)
LLSFARLRFLARQAGIRQIDAGPKAIALTVAEKATLKGIRKRWPDAVVKEGRIILAEPAEDEEQRLRSIERKLQELAAGE